MLGESGLSSKIDQLDATGFFQFPLTRERLQPMFHAGRIQATTFGIGCRPSPVLLFDTLGMYCRQVLFARATGIPRIFVLLAEDLPRSCAELDAEGLAKNAAAHRGLAARFAALAPDCDVQPISDREFTAQPNFAELVRQREAAAALTRNRYSLLQDAVFQQLAVSCGARVKGGWTRWRSETALRDSGAIERLDGIIGADEAAFDTKSRDAAELLGWSRYAYFYGDAARANSTESLYRAPYLDPRADSLQCACDVGKIGRIPISSTLELRDLLPDLHRPPGAGVKDNGGRRKWLEARIAFVEGAAQVVSMLRAVAPQFLPERVDCGAAESSAAIVRWQAQLAEVEQQTGGRTGKAYAQIARLRADLFAAYGSSLWQETMPPLQHAVAYFSTV